MKRKILIVDDYDVDRQALSNILCDDYDVIVADAGDKALSILAQSVDIISAILLDLVMPKPDGFDVLEKIRENQLFSNIPIIAMMDHPDESSEIRALTLGVIDFASKPFREEVIKQRLINVIRIRENAAFISTMRIDSLTGLYNRDTFYVEAEKKIKVHEPGYYIISCFDIDNFKVINDQYGIAMGDEVLKFMANVIKSEMKNIGGICARVNADDFVMLYPHSALDSEAFKEMHGSLKKFDINLSSFTVSIGRYRIDDLSISVSAMYDRALLALYSVKGNYENKVAQYDESMRIKMLKAQEIISEMQYALDSNQFEVWLQAQFNHATGEKELKVLMGKLIRYFADYNVTQNESAETTANQQLEQLKKSIPAGVISVILKPDKQQILYYNDVFLTMFGCSKEEKLKSIQMLGPLIYEDDRKELYEKGDRLLIDGTPFNCFYRIKKREGGCIWVSHRACIADKLEDGVIVNAFLMDISDQMDERERLRVSEEQNRLAVAHSGNVIARFDVRTRTLTLPESKGSIFKINRVQTDIPESQLQSGYISPDTAGAFKKLFDGIINGEAFGVSKFKIKSEKGWRWLEAHYTTVFIHDTEPISGVISFSDITEMLEKEIVYNKWQQSLSERSEESFTLFRCNLSNTSSVWTCEGKLLHLNYAYSQGTFDERASQYALRYVYQEDQSMYRAFLYSDTLLAEYYRNQRSKGLEYREVNADGSIRWLHLSVDLVEYPGSNDIEVYLMYEDIDEKRKLELIALETSKKDPLTGILNRASFIAKTEQILLTSKAGETHALLMFDVDNFKHINDAYGHAVGDKVLISISEKVSSIMRGYDLVGRLGGDEFFVFIKSIPGAEIALSKAQKICKLVSEIEDVDTPITVSMGIAMAPADGMTFEELYKKVDVALYEQKKNGKNGFRFVNM